MAESESIQEAPSLVRAPPNSLLSPLPNALVRDESTDDPTPVLPDWSRKQGDNNGDVDTAAHGKLRTFAIMTALFVCLVFFSLSPPSPWPRSMQRGTAIGGAEIYSTPEASYTRTTWPDCANIRIGKRMLFEDCQLSCFSLRPYLIPILLRCLFSSLPSMPQSSLPLSRR